MLLHERSLLRGLHRRGCHRGWLMTLLGGERLLRELSFLLAANLGFLSVLL